MQRMFDRHRALLLLLLFVLVVSGSSVHAQPHQRGLKRPPDRAGRGERATASDSQPSENIYGEQGKATTKSPFDVAGGATAGDPLDSPFHAPRETTAADAVVSPFGTLEGAPAGASVSDPFGSPGETPAGPRAVSSPFGSAHGAVSHEAVSGDAANSPAMTPAEPVNGLGEFNNETAVEQPESHAGAVKTETHVATEASVRRGFGDAYRPQFSAGAAPAFPGGQWSPWYSLQNKAGSDLAGVEIAFKYSGVAGQGPASDRPTSWALRNRSETTFAVEYQLNIDCGGRCDSGWHRFRAVIPAGKSVRGSVRELQQVRGVQALEVRKNERRKAAAGRAR